MEKNPNHNRGDGLLLRSATAQNSGGGGATRSPVTTTSPDFGLQWGNRKRLRCMKVQLKDQDSNNTDSSSTRNELQGSVRVQRTTGRVDRRAVRSGYSNKDPPNQPGCNGANGYINLRQRPASSAQRILRNSESSISMRGNINGVKGFTSPDRGGGGGGAEVGKTNGTHQQGNNYHNKSGNNHNENDNGALSSDSKKGEGSSSGSDAIPAVWPPKFVIALTNKEKEEDFIAIKGSKLPQRPKKRAKFIQRTLNLVSPGAWLCDLTLERYEVIEREKKITKKRPRGLKAMGNMVDSESE